MQLARQYNQFVNRFIMCGVFLARLKLARGDVGGAAALLAQAEQSVREHDFVHRMPEVVAVQVLMLLRQGSLTAAADLAQQYDLPMSRAEYSCPRETHPPPWRCWGRIVSRWKLRIGRMNGSR